MAYQALYRQWRPKTFSQMVGQEPIVETLRHQVETGRVAHAYLFCGSRGTGKTSTAKIFARAVNCLHPVHGDPCGECEICRRMASDEYLDILEFDAASNSRVEDARDLLDKVNFPPQFGAYKVYIIDEVHMMSSSAFNALLKTLEEPPEYLLFILATTEPQKLPPTILSRCQRFDFGRIPASQIAGRLREAVTGAGAEATDGALMTIARAAEGGMRDALSLLDMCLGYGKPVDENLVRSVLGTSDRAFLFRFSDCLCEEDAAGVIRMIDELMRSGKDPLVFSKDLSGHLRNLLMARCCGAEIAEALDLTQEDAGEYIRAGERVSTSRLMDMLDQFMKLETDLRLASSPRIALENTCLKCCLRTEAADSLAVNDRIAELENQIQDLKAQLASGVRPAAPTESTAPTTETGSKPAAKSGSKKNAAAGNRPAAPVDKEASEIWKKAVDILTKTEPSIKSFIVFGEFVGVEGDVWKWRTLPGQLDFSSQLNDSNRKPKIEAALSEAAGQPCVFLAEGLIPEKKEEGGISDEDYVSSLRGTLGAEAVSVVEDG